MSETDPNNIIPPGFYEAWEQAIAKTDLTFTDKRKLKKAVREQDINTLHELNLKYQTICFGDILEARNMVVSDEQATTLFRAVLCENMRLEGGMTQEEIDQELDEMNIKLTLSDKTEIKIRETPIMQRRT